MKTIGTYLLALLAASAVSASAQFSYYDLNGQPIQLSIIDTLVAVRLIDGSGAGVQTLATNHAVLADGLDFDFIGNQSSVFRLESGYTLGEAMLWLRLDDNVAMVNPVAHNSDGGRWTMNNRLIVTYTQAATQSQIDALQSQLGLTTAEVIDDSLRVYAVESRSSGLPKRTVHRMRGDAKPDTRLRSICRRPTNFEKKTPTIDLTNK